MGAGRFKEPHQEGGDKCDKSDSIDEHAIKAVTGRVL
jgi:hypothetical protein